MRNWRASLGFIALVTVGAALLLPVPSHLPVIRIAAQAQGAPKHRVLIGQIDKVSTLIGSLRLNIENVADGQIVFSRVLSFRGDTDDAWQHAVRFFVRDLQATAPQQH